MIINRQDALKRATVLIGKSSLDAATIAIGEQLTGLGPFSLAMALAALGNNQICEMAGFLNDSKTCKELEVPCDEVGLDLDELREWGLTRRQYCVAHEIALIAHMVDRSRIHNITSGATPKALMVYSS